jgi:glycosyltransferase involved in cell wall biosynthesis
LRTDVPQIAVIHDLNFEHYPEDLKAHHALYLRKFFPLFAKKASAIVTVSEFSKEDITNSYHINPSQITVAYNGVNAHFNTVLETPTGSFEPYFLFVGSIHPRKNLNRFLLAFDAFKNEFDSPHRLLIVGDPYYWSAEMKAVLNNLQHKSCIDFKPYASVDALKAYYQNAEALMFVSYFEGFGIPVVEAMACGCPVVVGKNTACDEIAGDSALKVDPFSVREISNAMVKIISDLRYREELIQSGIKRAQKFTWEHTGSVMNSVMNKFIR